MNRTDRLLAILLELQAKGHRRAEDLAATFETSKRTIYRDIQALCESGVPVIAVPGQGYSLVEGFFLPPVTFTTDEATLLLLGANFMAGNFDAQYRAAAESAGCKIEAVLNRKLRDEVHYLQKNIAFVTPENTADDKLYKLRQAILERKTARFVYYTRYPDSTSSPPAPRGPPLTAGHARAGAKEIPPREADPYSLFYFNGAWYLSAYCHTRSGVRNFRLDRMESLNLLPKTFSRPAAFDFDNSAPERAGRHLTIRALFDPGLTRWVRESRFFFVAAEAETPDGLLVTLKVRQESEALQWLLSWGSKVRVLEPDSLRQKMAEEVEAMLRLYR